MGLAFDAGRHEYLDTETGELLPSITALLKAAGQIDDRWYTEASRIRGSAVHRLTLAHDLGHDEIVEDAVGAYHGYLLAYQRALRLLRPRWTLMETPLAHPTLRYAGTPDRVGWVGPKRRRAVVELKTGRPQAVHALQTALQAMLVEPGARRPIDRYALYLQPDGWYRIVEFTAGQDFATAATIAQQQAHQSNDTEKKS